MSPLFRRLAGPLIVTAAAAGMAMATWNTWPDPIVDFGKEVYIAAQLAQGRRLYLDVAYHLGPLSPCVNALAFKIFGPTLAVLEYLNLLILAGILILTYRLIHRIAGDLAATTSGIALVSLFAFAHFTKITDYNFVAPYDHEHTHGLLLGLAGLAAADSYRRTGNRLYLNIAGLMVGLAFLTRAELFIPAAVGVTVIFATKPMELAPWFSRKKLAATWPFWVGAAIPILIALVLLSSILPSPLAWRGLFGSWPIVLDRSVSSNAFYRNSMGTLDLSASLWRLLLWSTIWLVIFLPPAAAAWIKNLKTLRLAIAFIWGLTLTYLAGHFFDPADAFAPLPLALLGVLLLAKFRNRRSVTIFCGKSPLLSPSLGIPGEGRGGGSSVVPQNMATSNGKDWPLSAGLIVYALALLGKIALNARIYHYGFALAMPATILLAAAGTAWLSTTFRAATLGALSMTIIAHLWLASTLSATQTYTVGEGPNRFLADNRGGMLNQIALQLRREALPGQTLAVMPEGAMLNFLSHMDNPTPYWSFNPPYSFFAAGQGEAAGEAKILAALKAHPPDWIVLVSENLSDFGTPFFGKDYGISLHDFVLQHYQEQTVLGDRPFSGAGFGMILMRRVYNESNTAPN